MSYMMSVGFATEYSVHITHRFITAPADIVSACDRVDYAMEFLFLPTFMGFISSTIGIACMGFASLQFVLKYFFTPLIIVMFVTYFYGCFFLPTVLQYLGCAGLSMGRFVHNQEQVSQAEASKAPTLLHPAHAQAYGKADPP